MALVLGCGWPSHASPERSHAVCSGGRRTAGESRQDQPSSAPRLQALAQGLAHLWCSVTWAQNAAAVWSYTAVLQPRRASGSPGKPVKCRVPTPTLRESDLAGVGVGQSWGTCFFAFFFLFFKEPDLRRVYSWDPQSVALCVLLSWGWGRRRNPGAPATSGDLP